MRGREWVSCKGEGKAHSCRRGFGCLSCSATPPAGCPRNTAAGGAQKKAAPVAVLSSTNERKYQLLEWMSKLCAMALPKSRVPS